MGIEQALLARVWGDKAIPGARDFETPPALVIAPPQLGVLGEYHTAPHEIYLYVAGSVYENNPKATRLVTKLTLLHEITHALLAPNVRHDPSFKWLLAAIEHRYASGWHGSESITVCDHSQPPHIAPRTGAVDYFPCPL